MSESKEKRIGKPEWKPNVEFFTSLSADGRFVICKTVITAIKPVGYFEKVMQGKGVSAPEKTREQKAEATDGPVESMGS